MSGDSSDDDTKSNNMGDSSVVLELNPKELDGVPDLSMLIYLEMSHVLHNLKFRYCELKAKHPYTSISTILVAINPYERLPIYGTDVIDEFHNAAKKGRLIQNRPHPYGVSARGYMRMIQRRCNQSMIVCGESGAGKTETTKLLMRYLAMTAPSVNMEQSMVEQQIIAASPILEAYGNAKTVMNNNSSRFGKFTKLLYDVPPNAREGHILGSYLETYLLEKSRVVFQSPNERNYHIFYFLHAGIPKDQHKDYFFNNCDNFWYTNQGKAAQVTGINDKDRYEELTESLKLMRIGDDLQPSIWKLTAGILNLGNVEFKREGDGFASILPKSQQFVRNCAILWGIEEQALTKRLTTKTMKVGTNKIEKKVQFDDASVNRDSIAKGLYENIFLWFCERINAELYQTDESKIESILFIGILDVFGFENFYINSLEQFCINFTNEKLQQYFNHHIIVSEQEEYIKESVFWKPLSIADNQEYIRLIEDKQWGFFTILDSACKAPEPNPLAFTQELFKRWNDNPTLHVAKKPGSGNYRGGPKKKIIRRGKSQAKFDGFMIEHFADDVTYDISVFLPKNNEAVHPDTAKMMKKSTNALAAQIGGRGVKGKKKLSVTGTFYKGIKTLMRNLKATEPFFVRCVNPNQVKSKEVWDQDVVEHQLRCGGLVEALKVLKLGYPTRVPYSTLYDRYHSNVTNPLIKNMGPEGFSTALLIAFDVSEEDYELGLTKIFFKPSKAAILDTIMSQAGQPLSEKQNAKITKWVVQKRIKQMIGTTKAFLSLRKRVRLVRAAQRWEWSGRVCAILGGTVIHHLSLARHRILERKRKHGALSMQAFYRGYSEYNKYNKTIYEVKEATKIIWESYRRWNERKQLSKWLDIKVIATKKRKEEERIKQLKEEALRLAKEQRELAEKKRIEEEERLRNEAKLKQEFARKKEEEEKQRILEEARKKAEEAQRLAAIKIEEERILNEEKLKIEEKQKKEFELEKKNRLRIEQEQEIEDTRVKEIIKKNFAEQDSSDESSSNSDDSYKKNKKHDKKHDSKGSKHHKSKKYDKNGKRKHHRKHRKSSGASSKGSKKKSIHLKNRSSRPSSSRHKGTTSITVKKRKSIKFSQDIEFKNDFEDENGMLAPELQQHSGHHSKRSSRSVSKSNSNSQHGSDSEENYRSDDSYSSSNTSNESNTGSDDDLEDQLSNFQQIAATGQLFLKYTGGKRMRKPQDRIVKVSFSHENKPNQISWGSGSRHIDFNDIQYIASGHWTPTFEARSKHLDKSSCLSVVGKNAVLDIQAHTKEMAQLWVKGLRRLLGHSDEKSDELARKMKESGNLLPSRNGGDNSGGGGGGKGGGKRRPSIKTKDHANKTKSLMLLQQDLFVMTTSTVFRGLEDERIWEIDQSLREKFNAKDMYLEALKLDVPWRQWNHWIRKRITDYLKNQADQLQNQFIPQQPYNPYQPQQPFNVQNQPPYDTNQNYLPPNGNYPQNTNQNYYQNQNYPPYYQQNPNYPPQNPYDIYNQQPPFQQQYGQYPPNIQQQMQQQSMQQMQSMQAPQPPQQQPPPLQSRKGKKDESTMNNGNVMAPQQQPPQVPSQFYPPNQQYNVPNNQIMQSNQQTQQQPKECTVM